MFAINIAYSNNEFFLFQDTIMAPDINLIQYPEDAVISSKTFITTNKLFNKSTHPIYLVDSKIEHLYDDSISQYNNINYIQNSSGNYTVNPNLAYYYSIVGNIRFFDSISAKSNYLIAKVTQYYRNYSSIEIDSFHFYIKFRAVRKSDLFEFLPDYLSSKANYQARSNFNSKDRVLVPREIINYFDSNIIIDSIQHLINGQNFANFGIYAFGTKGDSLVHSPQIISMFSNLRLGVYHSPIIPERSVCYFSIFYRFENSDETRLIKDSIVRIIQPFDGIRIGGTTHTWARDLNKGGKLTDITIRNYLTDTITILKPIATNLSEGEMNYNPEENFPIKLAADKSIKIKSLEYIVRSMGLKKAKMDFNFLTKEGDTIKHDIVFFITPDTTTITDVIDSPKDALNIGISPNPANNYLQFSIPEKISINSDIFIYSLEGALRKIIPQSMISQQVDISELQSGLYFVKMIINDTKYVNKFIILRN